MIEYLILREFGGNNVKKFLSLIVIAIAFTAMGVRADMGAPSTKSYKAEVTNPDGARLYVWDSKANKSVESSEKIPYGTELNVVFEYEGMVSIENQNGTIRIEDISPVSETYEVKDSELSTQKIEALTLQAVEIKKGPAEAYKGTGKTIEKGKMAIIRFFADGNNPWAYVEFEGTEGFINILSGVVAYNPQNVSGLINKNIVLKNPFNERESEIKANTEIDFRIYQLDPWSRSYYVSYGDNAGVVSYDDITYKDYKSIYKTTKTLDLHESLVENSKIVGTIEANTVLKDAYVKSEYGDIYIYVADRGWIFTTFEKGEVEISENVDYVPPQEEPKKEIDTDKNASEIKNPMELMYICIAVAVIVSLTGVVTLALINKKSKTKSSDD